MLGYTLHLVSSHYTAGWRKQSGNAWEKEEKARNEKGKGKGWNRPDRQGHGGTHSRMEEKEKL